MLHFVTPNKHNYTDSVCAAAGYTELQRIKKGNKAICLLSNPPNPQTEYLLKRFPCQHIKIVQNLHPRAEHLTKEKIICIKATDSVARALELYSLYGYRQVPVVSAQNRCLGIL